MITAAITPAFAAQPPVSAATGMRNELEVVNETGSELRCVVAARRAGHMPALPMRTTSNVLTSPRASDVFIERQIEPGKTFTIIINLQDNESVMVGGQLLSVDHAHLQNKRCTIKVSRGLFGYGAISISEPACVALGMKDIDVGSFREFGLTPKDIRDAGDLLQHPDSEAYRVLGVPQGAPKLEIDEAFRNLMNKWQPHEVEWPFEKEIVYKMQRKIKAAHALMIAGLNK